MAKISIEKELCKGCGLCAKSCPKKLITLSDKNMNNSGYFVAEFIGEDKCIGCALCAIMCPDVCITVEK